MKWIKLGGIYLAMFLFTTACTNMCSKGHMDMSPEDVVEAYLDIAFGMTDVSQRIDLARYTTGLLRSEILSVKDEVIRKAYIDRKYKLLSYAVVERQDRTPKEVEVTFQLSFKVLGDAGNLTPEAKAPTMNNENTVRVIKVNQKWMIDEVLGKKTTIDFPVNPEDVITPDP